MGVRSSRLGIGLLTAVLVFAYGVPTAAAAASMPHFVLPTMTVTATASTNWGGYAVTGSQNSFTDVKGSWIQPAIHGSCPSQGQYASFWVGLDGFSSSTVEQTGTDSDCQGGTPTYYAWYEFYPHPSFLISTVAIHAGDVIFAEVKYSNTTHKFTTTLKDVTTGHSFSKTAGVSGAKRNSAEWIAEAPYSGGILPLADFGTVDFGKDYTGVNSTNDATMSGHTHPIGSFAHIWAITMINNAGTMNKATPSALSSTKTSFTMTWVSAGP